MRAYTQNHSDPTFQPHDKSAFERFCGTFLADERDYPFVLLCLKILLIIVPISALLYSNLLSGWQWWAVAIFHILYVNIALLSPFTLMLHNTSHNRFFKVEYSWGNYIIPWIVGPFMGQSPELYYSHHIGMHHAEGNMPEDESSTMPYKRDSFAGFLVYFTNFFFIKGWIDLIFYFKKRNRWDFVKKCLTGEPLFYVMVITLGYFNLPATLVVFLLPFFIIRFGMMAGNWGQHAFVDKDQPDNPYLNSITCINSGYNHRCFNDGYHIGHHVKPRLHWTEMPTDFDKNVQRYAEHKSIVFEKLDHGAVWLFLMLHRYDWLASYAVNINNTFSSDEEFINVMKSRLVKLV